MWYPSVNALLEDRRGVIWMGGSIGLARLEGERWYSWVGKYGAPLAQVISFGEDVQGTVWAGTTKGLWRLGHNEIEIFDRDHGFFSDTVYAVRGLARASDDTLWLGTPQGLGGCRFEHGTPTCRVLTTSDGLPSNAVSRLAESAEGHLLVGTASGLCRYDFETLSCGGWTEGVPGGQINALLVFEDNRLVVGTDTGLAIEQRSPDAKRSPESLVVRPDGFAQWIGRDSQPGFLAPRTATTTAVALASVAEFNGALPALGQTLPPLTITQADVTFRIMAAEPNTAPGKNPTWCAYAFDDQAWSRWQTTAVAPVTSLGNGAHVLRARCKSADLVVDATPTTVAFSVALPTPLWLMLSPGFVALAVLWFLRRRLRLLWLYVSHLRYRPIPTELFLPRGPLALADELVGRDGVLAWLHERAVHADQANACVVLLCEPGGGLSSVLRSFQPPANVLCVKLELGKGGESEVSGFIGEIAGAILKAATDAGIRIEMPLAGEPVHQFSLSPSTQDLLHNPYRSLEALLLQLCAAAPTRPLMLVLDNANLLHELASRDDRFGDYLIGFLKDLVYNAKIRVLLCLGLVGDSSLLSQRFADLFAIASTRQVTPLSLAETAELLQRRARPALTFSPDACALIHRQTGGRIRVIEQLGAAIAGDLAAERRNLVHMRDVEAAAQLVLQQTIGPFEALWAALGSKNRLVLSLLAELGATPRDLLVQAARERQAPFLEEELHRRVEQLLRDHLLAEDAGVVRVGATLLERWLCEYHPFKEATVLEVDSIGHYQILDRIGEGGMGVVYRARDPITSREVALKVMNKALVGSDNARKRFLREAEMGLRLKHPGIVRIFERGEIDLQCFIAMELLQGTTLRQYVRTLGPLAWREALDILASIADALSAVHEHHIVHRDLKSENIMLVGPERSPKLMDFGLARWSDLSSMTGSHALLGTMPYMSPEQVAGEPPEPSWDLYALGVIGYEMLTKTVPFAEEHTLALLRAIAQKDPPPLASHGVTVPAAVEALIMRLLQKDPQRRPLTASDVRQAVLQVVKDTE
jgi:hypothetical protein